MLNDIGKIAEHPIMLIMLKHQSHSPKAITFTTYGGFGKATHDLITKLTSEATGYDFDPWARPSPKSHAYLTFGFALARANARMLINADSKRRSARNRVRTSRQRSASLE